MGIGQTWQIPLQPTKKNRGFYRMIEKGDHPNTDPKENKNLNKFLRSNNWGERGLLLATNKKKDKGVIFDFYNQRIILVHEIDPEAYPKFSKTLLKIPKDFEDIGII